MHDEAHLAYLPEHIRQALATDGRSMEMGIRVAAAGGRVVLTGTVPTDEHRRMIEEVCRERCGDLVVVNDIEVSPVTEPDGAEELG